MKTRCAWCGDDTVYMDYHDNEWGVPLHDQKLLFEFLILEGAQAGLSWITILKRRDNYREAFDNFEYEKIAKYDEVKVESLLNNAGIIRNRLKIASAIKNAKAFMEVQKEFGSFDSYIWAYVDDTTIQNKYKSMDEIPVQTELSQQMSKDMKKRGFNFVGPTICYAFMQAIGMVNDHIPECYRYEEVKKLLKS